VQDRSRALRRRLRELTDRALALGSVHGRFGPGGGGSPADRAPEPASAPPMRAPPSLVPPAPVFTPAVLAPPKEETHEPLLAALSDRHGEGFTVGQMRELMEELDGRGHTYDAAWALANNLLRTRALEIAGTRPGTAGPIRVLRVARVARVHATPTGVA